MIWKICPTSSEIQINQHRMLLQICVLSNLGLFYLCVLSNLNFLFRFFAVKICADLYFILTIYESQRDTINIVRFKTFIFISPHGLTGCQRGFLKWHFLGNCGDFLELNRRRSPPTLATKNVLVMSCILRTNIDRIIQIRNFPTKQN